MEPTKKTRAKRPTDLEGELLFIAEQQKAEKLGKALRRKRKLIAVNALFSSSLEPSPPVILVPAPITISVTQTSIPHPDALADHERHDVPPDLLLPSHEPLSNFSRQLKEHIHSSAFSHAGRESSTYRSNTSIHATCAADCSKATPLPTTASEHARLTFCEFMRSYLLHIYDYATQRMLARGFSPIGDPREGPKYVPTLHFLLNINVSKGTPVKFHTHAKNTALATNIIVISGRESGASTYVYEPGKRRLIQCKVPNHHPYCIPADWWHCGTEEGIIFAFFFLLPGAMRGANTSAEMHAHLMELTDRAPLVNLYPSVQ